jgi:DNA-binding transcriptional LysR family regulator
VPEEKILRRPRIEVFDLNLLRILDALYRHRSVNLAAAEIGVSPSAISHALGRLRQNFEDELFVKGVDGMVPTTFVIELAEPIAEALRHLGKVLGPQQFEPKTSLRQFKVRANTHAAALLLPEVIRRLRDEAPNATMMIDCEYSKSIADELDASLVDVVIGAFSNLPSRLDSEILFSDRWCWVMRADHPVLQGDPTPETLMEQPLLVIAATDVAHSDSGMYYEAGVERPMVASRQFIDDQRGRSRFMNIKGTVVLNSAEPSPSIVANSDLIALIPQRMASQGMRSYNLAILPFNDEHGELDHRIVWHRRNSDDAAITWLRSLFSEVARDIG